MLLLAGALLLLTTALVGQEAATSRLTSDAAEDRSPDCSPDGATVVFSSDRAGSMDLYLLDLQSGALRRLTDAPGEEMAPAWSPSGDRIVFHRRDEEGDEEQDGLWILDLSTGAQRLLLAEQAVELTPDWSPDGDWIAFNSQRHGALDLYRVRVDGSGTERLTDSPYRDLWPRYSPDGEQVVFFSRRATEGAADDLFLLDLKSREVLRITEHPDHHDFVPAWSPDGVSIVAGESRHAENRRELVVFDLGGSVTRRFAQGYHRVFHPTWCADGSLVFAARVREGESADLYRTR